MIPRRVPQKDHAHEEPTAPRRFHSDRDRRTRGPVRNGRRQGAADVPASPLQFADGKAGLSGEMALRIEKAFGVKIDTLMRMQSSYDIAQTRKREKDIRVQRIRQPAEIRL